MGRHSTTNASVGAICRAILAEAGVPPGIDPEEAARRAEGFVLRGREAMPDYLRLPFRLMTAVFCAHALVREGGRFRNLPRPRQTAHLRRWRRSRISWCRDFARFHESLAIFSLYSSACGNLAEHQPADDLEPIPIPAARESGA